MILLVGCTDSTAPTESGAGAGGDSGGSSEESSDSSGSGDSSGDSSSDSSSTSTKKSTTKTKKKATKTAKKPAPPPPKPLTVTEQVEKGAQDTLTNLKALFAKHKGSKTEDVSTLVNDIKNLNNVQAAIDKILSITGTDAEIATKLKETDADGKSYLDHALESGNWQIARILIAAGDNTRKLGRIMSIHDYLWADEPLDQRILWTILQEENITTHFNREAGFVGVEVFFYGIFEGVDSPITPIQQKMLDTFKDMAQKISAINVNFKNSNDQTAVDMLLNGSTEADPEVIYVRSFGGKKASEL